MRVIPSFPISPVAPLSSGITSRDPLSSEPPPPAELQPGSTSTSLLSTTTLHSPAQDHTNPSELPSQDTSTKTHTASPLPPLSPSPAASPNPHHELTDEGQSIHQPILYPNISINVGTARLNLDLSSETIISPSPEIPSDPSSRCKVRVQWLQGAETGTLTNSTAINAEDLSYDTTEMEFCHGAARTPTEFHLRRGEDFVSIKYTFDEPR